MSRAEELKLLNKRRVGVALALISIGVAYVFASLAIDSGSLFEYVATIFFLVLAIKYFVRAVRR